MTETRTRNQVRLTAVSPEHTYLTLEERVVAGVASVAAFPLGGSETVLGVEPEVEAACLESLRVLPVHSVRLLVHLQVQRLM